MIRFWIAMMRIISSRRLCLCILAVGTAGFAFCRAGLSQTPGDSHTADVSEQLIPGMVVEIPIDQPILKTDSRKPVALPLINCVHRALENNLDIRISGYDPAIRMTSIVEAEAAFDAVLFSTAQWDIADQPNIDSGFFTRNIQTDKGTRPIKVPTDPFTEQRDYNYSLGLRKRLPTGASVQIAQNLRRFRDLNGDALYLNPYYESSTALELRQPLLRDFGIDINRAEINAAQNNYQISRQQFQRTVIQIAADIETAYWRLVFARQRIAIYENQLQQAELTLRRLIERKSLDAGSDVLARNRGLIERAKANLLAAQNDALQQQDQLLVILNDPNLPLGGKWEIVTQDLPTTQNFTVDRQQALQAALKMRPELIAQKIQVDPSRIAVGGAENQLLPRLDLVAQETSYGADDSYSSGFDNQRELDTISSRVGLSFELPLGGNRAAQAALARAKHQLQQDNLRLKSFEDQVSADVSTAVSRLESSREEIHGRQNAARAEADVLRSYEAREDAEATITSEFLDRKMDALERLANVQLQVIQTLFEYNVSIMDVHRAQGLLLRYNNIKLMELPESASSASNETSPNR